MRKLFQNCIPQEWNKNATFKVIQVYYLGPMQYMWKEK